MKVFEWRGNELLGHLEFREDDAGLDAFSEYLQDAPEQITQLLVDVIEEDFRQESIPHVGARDRKALINRLLDRHYRDEEHHQVRMISRSNSGRKDDHILMSALSNFEQINPWIIRLEENQVPLAGIWSAPLLMEKFLKIQKLKKENLLVVSRELAFSQRETFFKNGRLIFSRLEKLEFNVRDSEDIDKNITALQNGVDQIRHFLTNQRIIGFVEKLYVICLVPDRREGDYCDISQDSTQVVYEYLGLNNFYKKFRIKGCDGLPADALISWLCATDNRFNDHYGTKKQKKHFTQFVIDKSIENVSTFSALLLVTAAALLWLDSTKLQQNINSLSQGTTALENRYAEEFGDKEQKMDDAYIIQSIVNHYSLLHRETEQTPHKYFPVFASVFSQPRFAKLELNEMLWSKHSREMVSEAVRQMIGRRGMGDDDYDDYDEQGDMEQGSEENLLLMQPVIKLVGKLDRNTLSYTNTVIIMRSFVDALENLDTVAEIHLIKTPVDIRPDVLFSDKKGVDSRHYAKNANADAYEILLVMEPESDV